jgi:hypothetical protein
VLESSRRSSNAGGRHRSLKRPSPRARRWARALAAREQMLARLLRDAAAPPTTAGGGVRRRAGRARASASGLGATALPAPRPLKRGTPGSVGRRAVCRRPRLLKPRNHQEPVRIRGGPGDPVGVTGGSWIRSSS